MFGGVIIWFALSLLIGVWASKLGREGIVWGLIAAFISPLLAAICLLVMSHKNDDATTSVNGSSTEGERDKEWEVVKKYVPEVNSSLGDILDQLDNKGISSAEEKLKELFFVIGREGLTKEALSIIVVDVKNEIEEQERLFKSSAAKRIEGTVYNMELVENLKGNVKIGFNSNFSLCEICGASRTGQTLNGYYVCSGCKQKHL